MAVLSVPPSQLRHSQLALSLFSLTGTTWLAIKPLCRLISVHLARTSLSCPGWGWPCAFPGASWRRLSASATYHKPIPICVSSPPLRFMRHLPTCVSFPPITIYNTFPHVFHLHPLEFTNLFPHLFHLPPLQLTTTFPHVFHLPHYNSTHLPTYVSSPPITIRRHLPTCFSSSSP